MNTKLLKQVANRILKYPDRYDQNKLGIVYDCGCIMYQVRFIDRRPITVCSKLDISPDQHSVLCGTHEQWPEPFRTQYAKAKSAKGRARVGYRRIMYFIKSKGK